MNIVIDTNIILSGLFFGGYPRKVLEAVLDDECTVFASSEIIDEYTRIVDEYLKKHGNYSSVFLLLPLIAKMKIIEPKSTTNICRDKDDNKFLNCAIDANAIYIVTGDQDLLVLAKFSDTQIITAKEFVTKALMN